MAISFLRVKKRSVYLSIRDHDLFTNLAWCPRSGRCGMRSIPQYCNSLTSHCRYPSLARRYCFISTLTVRDVAYAGWTAATSSSRFDKVSSADKGTVLEGGEVSPVAHAVCLAKKEHTAGPSIRRNGAMISVYPEGFHPSAMNSCGTQAEDLKRLPFRNSKKIVVSVGGQDDVDCGVTTILSYKVRAGSGNKHSLVLFPSKNLGGRREWIKDKYEHCSAGTPYEVTP
jgi:hypothetical protein